VFTVRYEIGFYITEDGILDLFPPSSEGKETSGIYSQRASVASYR
jgi:hypothetical protein